jgi:Flp pilus assembly protein TadG
MKPTSDSSTSRIPAALYSAEASQLVEFAVVLPFLVVLVIGIFDFGAALNLKQQLTIAAREGAAFGSSLPTNDLGPTGSSGSPQSIVGVRDLVDAYLIQSRIQDCGLSAATQGSSTWTWVATGGGCPGGTFTLTIDRGYVFKVTTANGSVDLVSTQVSISYPYSWTFNNVIQLVAPGANFGASIQLATSSVVPNLQ